MAAVLMASCDKPGTSAGDCGAKDPALDLEREPNYQASNLDRWSTRDGCDVRLDVLMTRTEACFDDVKEVLMGTPLGKSMEETAARSYASDIGEELGEPANGEVIDFRSTIPAEARDTGFLQGDAQLWIDRTDDSAIYLVFSDHTEKWPLIRNPNGCG